MSDAVVEFFRELGRRGHEPLLAKVTGAGGCRIQPPGAVPTSRAVRRSRRRPS